MKLNAKLNEIGNGALQEHFERELEKVIENLLDINTDPSKARKITLNVNLKSDDNRELVFVEVGAKSTLVAFDSTPLILTNGVDSNGERVINELKSGLKGQGYIDEDGELKNDDGTTVELPKSDKVRNMYK